MNTKTIIIIILAGIISLTIYVIAKNSMEADILPLPIISNSESESPVRSNQEEENNVTQIIPDAFPQEEADLPEVVADIPEKEIPEVVADIPEEVEVKMETKIDEPKSPETLQRVDNNEIKNTAGKYIDYSEQLAVEAAKNGDAVLFFHASWCPTCRNLNSNLKASSIPENLTILKVDYDSYSDLKRKYGISYQHTLVHVDTDLSLIKKWNGSRDLGDIVSQIR